MSRIYDPAALPSHATNGAAPRSGVVGVQFQPTDKVDPVSYFNEALLTATALGELAVPVRRALLADWLCAGDLGFLFAQRGVGKTWLALLLARAIAGGEPAGPWKSNADAPGRVLYVDGEMPLELLKARQRGLAMAGERVVFLNHEQLFWRTDQVLNLTDAPAQGALTKLCEEQNFDVLILDNLSCLFRGVSENDADAWEAVLPWLLELRRRKVAVIIVAHAGRNNAMRGTSRREDAAAWVVRLDDALDTAGPKSGAKFVASFTKPSRNTPQNLPPLEFSVTTDAGGQSRIAYKEAEGDEAVLGWVRNGLTACSEIAEAMGVSKGTVSKLATRLIEQKRLKKENRHYIIPLTGNEVGEEEE